VTHGPSTGLPRSVAPPGMLLNVQRFTATGTYTPTAGTRAALIEGVGSGGGGGGADQNGLGGGGCGGGGGAGAYAKHWWSSVKDTLTYAVAIGALGTDGSAGNNAGNAGGASQFAGVLALAGGLGGNSMVGSTFASYPEGGAGGAVTNGGNIVSTQGVPGRPSNRQSANVISSGAGASSPLGSGGVGVTTTVASNNGTGYGAGGGGACALSFTSDQAGGDGTAGVFIVYEYS
jgi:hypothetical protein